MPLHLPNCASITEEQAQKIFDEVGFDPPAGMPIQEALLLVVKMIQQQQAAESKGRRPKGRTAVPCTLEESVTIIEKHGGSLHHMAPCGLEIQGIDLTGGLTPDLAGAMEVQMAKHGLLLFRQQGQPQNESGVSGVYLTGEEQCILSEAFGVGALHSTHGVHPKSPGRDVFRLSNDPAQGFNSVGPEWHNDGSFCREVFGHVVYHIVKAPSGPGDTCFAHLGAAHDLVPVGRLEQLRRCASVNSNGGVVHPLVHRHHISGRESLYLHTGMTGAIIERCEEGPPGSLSGICAWSHQEMNEFFIFFTDLLDRPDVRLNHKWAEGDVVIIDNLAVAHKAAPGAHVRSSGLRILHRTTIKSDIPVDPDPTLNFPIEFDMNSPCPFAPRSGTDSDAVWLEGYVGFRWGDWNCRSVPH